MAKLKITPLNQFVKGVFHFYDIFFIFFLIWTHFMRPSGITVVIHSIK